MRNLVRINNNRCSLFLLHSVEAVYPQDSVNHFNIHLDCWGKAFQTPLTRATMFLFIMVPNPMLGWKCCSGRKNGLEFIKAVIQCQGKMVLCQLHPINEKLNLFKLYAATMPCTSRAKFSVTVLVFLFLTKRMPRRALSHKQVCGRQ